MPPLFVLCFWFFSDEFEGGAAVLAWFAVWGFTRLIQLFFLYPRGEFRLKTPADLLSSPMQSLAEPVEVQRRLSDLQNERLVEKSGKRPCRVTGRMASTWAVAEEREVAA
jgi:hypothetical protein